MAYVTSFQPSGSPIPNIPVGPLGSNSAQTGWLPGNNARVFNYIQNTAGGVSLYASFGAPVSTGQFHIMLPPSGVWTDPGMVKVPIFISGGSYVAWSM